MSDESAAVPIQPLYILKVLAGLMALGLLVLVAVWVPLSGISPKLQTAATTTLVALALALPPCVRYIYRRRDELQRRQYQEAGVNGAALLASALTVVGILQASQWLPLFNQFWTLALLIGIWGFQLMRSDRRFR